MKKDKHKLLAIPNDPISAYHRNDREDFLSEFNPRISRGDRFFDSVAFLNWKDKVDGEYCGVDSYSFLEDKREAYQLMQELSSGERPFSSPLFEPIFEKEKDRIIEISRRLGPDIVRAFNTHFAAELGYMVSRELDIPLVITANDPSRLTSAVTYGDGLISLSGNMADACVEDYGADLSKITIIPDAVDTKNLFYPRSEAQYLPVVGSDYNGTPKILSVGRIVPNKNIETLLEAISVVKKDFPYLKHIHLGNGDRRSVSNIESLRDSLGLGDNSFFLRGIQKNQLPFYYSWADVYALPTLWEGLGRAQIEALACKTPVVTTNSPPMNEVVTQGHNGLLIDPRDPLDLARAISRILTEPDLRTLLEENSRSSVEDEYSLEVVGKKLTDFYQRILGEK